MVAPCRVERDPACRRWPTSGSRLLHRGHRSSTRCLHAERRCFRGLSSRYPPLPSASASILIGLVKCWFEHRTAPAWTHQSKPVRAWWSCCGHKECTLQRLQRSRGRIQDLVMFGPKSVVCILRESSCASPMSMRTRRKNCKPSRRSSQKAARGMLKVKQVKLKGLG